MNIILLCLLSLFGCSSENKPTISIEHAECLFLYTVGGVPDREGNVVNVSECDEKWTWVQREGWNICEKQGFAYKIEFNKDDLYVINMLYSSTGSGEFTNLILIDIKDDVFTLIDTIAGGDRCQHGLVFNEVEYKDNQIYYSEFITPFHLMSWNGRNLPFDAYDDCMICCCGSAKYKYNPLTKVKVFLNVELLLDELKENDSFSKTYNLFLKRGTKILEKNDIDEFINKVEND